MKYLLIPLFCLSIVSCESDDETRQRVKARNRDTLTTPIELTLADGKVVKRYEFRNPENLREYPHYIYVVEGATTVTNNTLVRQGKVDVPQVHVAVVPTVIIDGTKYVPAEKQ